MEDVKAPLRGSYALRGIRRVMQLSGRNTARAVCLGIWSASAALRQRVNWRTIV
jgi:hypothetical protein